MVSPVTENRSVLRSPSPASADHCLSRRAVPSSTTANGFCWREVGTAFTFTRECGPLSFPARGPILDNGERVLLAGRLPKVDARCQNIGSVDHELEFRLVKRFFDEVPPNGASGEPPAPPKEPPSPSPREQPPSSNGSKSGTGFYVSNDGYLITDEHVVNSCNTVKVVDAASPDWSVAASRKLSALSSVWSQSSPGWSGCAARRSPRRRRRR